MAKETVYNNTLVSGAADETLTYTRYVKDESSGKSTKELLDEKVNKTDQLGTTQIADKAVTTEKLENESVTTDKLDAASVTTDKVADANITTSKLADSSVETEKINNKAVTTDKLNDGAVVNSKLSPNAVTSEKIKDESIITEKLNDRAVTTEKVEEKAITNNKIGDSAVDGRTISEASVEKKHLANDSVATEKLQDSSVTSDKIHNDAITEGKIKDSSVSNSKLADNSVGTSKIKDGNITNEKVANNTLTQDKLDPELRKAIQAATGLPENLIEVIQDVDKEVKTLHSKDTDLQSQITDKQQQITAHDKDIELLQTRSTQMEQTINNIAATGGASVANTVAYTNTTSGLVSVNAQGAIDELAAKNKSQDATIIANASEVASKFSEESERVNGELAKKANTEDVTTQMQTEQERVNAEFAKKFDKESISQESGEAEDKVMSQKAVSAKLSDLSNKPFVYSSVNDISKLSWIDGKFISLNGNVEENVKYCYSSPMQVKKSTIISFHNYMNGIISLISKCKEDGSDISPLVLLTANESSDRNIDYVVTEDCYVILCSTIEKRDKFIISSNSILTTLSVRNNDKLFLGKNVSFLGDNITSYKKYSKCELGGYPDSTVLTSESMWWNLVSQMLGMNIDTVNAVSGASITRNSDRACLLDRCEDLGNPDIIFIAAGTNDIYVNSEIGEESFAKDKSDLSDTKFFEAYDLLCRKIHERYPNAEIILIVPAHCSMEDGHTNKDGQNFNEYIIQGNHGLFREAIYKIALHYSLRIVDLSRVNIYIPKKDVLHPNFQGMQMMADYIKTSLFVNLDESSKYVSKLSYDEQINSFFKEIYYNGSEDLFINIISREYILNDAPNWQIQFKIGSKVINAVFVAGSYNEPSLIEYTSTDELTQVKLLVDWKMLKKGNYFRYTSGIKISNSCKDINSSPTIKAIKDSVVLKDNHLLEAPILDSGWNSIIKEIYYTGNKADLLVLVSFKNNQITANICNSLITASIQDGIAELYKSADKRLFIAVDNSHIASISEYSKILNITGKDRIFEQNYSPIISAFLKNIIPTENLMEFYAKGKKSAFFDKEGALNFKFGEKVKHVEDGASIALSTSQETTQRYIAVWAPFTGYTEDNIPKYVMAVGVSEDGKFFDEITRFDIASLSNPKWKWLRDPSIIRYNGVFYVAIGANEGNDSYFGILKSEDLKNWSLLKNIKCSYNDKLLKPTAPEIFMVDDKPYVVFQGSFAYALTRPKCYMIELNDETFSTSSEEQTLTTHYIDIGESTAIDYSVIKADNGKYILGMARDWTQTFYESDELFGEYKYVGEAHFGRLTEGTNIVRIAEGTYRVYLTTSQGGNYSGYLLTRDFKHFYGPTPILNSNGRLEYRHGTVLALKVKSLDKEKILKEIL